MTTIAENLPCVPFEAPAAAGVHVVPYQEYWRQYQAAYPRQKDAENLRRLAVAGSVLVRTPDKFTGVPAPERFGVNSSSPIPEIIETWDRALGPSLHDASGDLLRGAATILQLNQTGCREDFPVVRNAGDPDVVDAFLDIADQIEIGRQRPSHALLIGAQLVHKAAWLESDNSRHKDLSETASKLYSRIDDPSVPWGPDRFRAAQYQQDTQFHLLSNELRPVLRRGENPWWYQGEALRLLRKGAQDILRMYEAVASCEDEARVIELTGEMTEPFVNQVTRDNVFVRRPLTADHLEIRSALGSEDEPIEAKSRLVDSNIDNVLQTVSETGQLLKAEPLQIKTGRGAEIRTRPYHPAIKVVTLKGLSGSKMRRIGKDLLRSYDCYQFERIIEGLDLVLDPLEPYLAPAMSH